MLDEGTGGDADERALSERRETTVVVVDDHRSFSDLLSASLEAASGIRCLATAVSADEGLQLAAALRPSVVVMDIEMPGLDGLSATRRLRSLIPATAVAVVSAHSGPAWIARARRAGASAFIPKGVPLRELVEMLRAARPGPMVVAPSAADLRAPRSARSEAALDLTARELEVLGLLAVGRSDKEIAAELGISINTGRGYLRTVYAALHAGSRIEALNEARRRNLID